MKINLGLDNSDLYCGCEIEEVAGRLNLKTPIDKAVNIIGRNINRIISNDNGDRSIVVLTGPMAVWSYLIVFHAVVHKYREVMYDDGRNQPVIIARHG